MRRFNVRPYRVGWMPVQRYYFDYIAWFLSDGFIVLYTFLFFPNFFDWISLRQWLCVMNTSTYFKIGLLILFVRIQAYLIRLQDEKIICLLTMPGPGFGWLVLWRKLIKFFCLRLSNCSDLFLHVKTHHSDLISFQIGIFWSVLSLSLIIDLFIIQIIFFGD